MEFIRTFLEPQSLLSMFLVIALGYAIGAVNIRGFNLGIGAVLFVGLGVGMLASKAAPPALLAKDAQAVCVFVNEQVDRPCLEALVAQGVKLVALAAGKPLVEGSVLT